LCCVYIYTSDASRAWSQNGSTPSRDIFDGRLSPLEANISLKYQVRPGYRLILGAGAGLTGGVGAPQWRVITGVRIGLYGF
jgi:hypothetical protein